MNWQSSSRSIIGAILGSGASPCHFGLSSMCSTPFPLMVLATIIDGAPFVAIACDIALSSCSIR